MDISPPLTEPAGASARPSEYAEETQGRLRKLSLEIVIGALSAVGSLLVARDAHSWWDALLMAGGLLVTLLVLKRWGAGRFPGVALPALIVTAAIWLVGVLAADITTPVYSFAIVATLALVELRRHRPAVIAGITAVTIVVLAARVVTAREELAGVLLKFVIVSAGVAVGGIILTILAAGVHNLIGELEKAREREAEMAVMRERVRFAGDLHDIQGHTLHVVKLKVTLAKKLLHSDLARVEEELEEVRALVGDTITQTRELAYAQRRLNLSAELENAKNLFEAAGISAHVDRAAGVVDPRASELLGQVLRETTTNILRHAEAGEVRVTLSETGVTIVNDGAQDGPLPALRGLAALRERVVGEGGELTVEQENGWFRTAVAFP
ncbi:histidine kinase [Nonomuraea sp. NPDC050404]|uniref:sensor histidine kinase n=1 Tax=Nonomuraea sp. NPDC050404 TaxID=3155783 RepID=UPI0033DC530A